MVLLVVVLRIPSCQLLLPVLIDHNSDVVICRYVQYNDILSSPVPWMKILRSILSIALLLVHSTEYTRVPCGVWPSHDCANMTRQAPETKLGWCSQSELRRSAVRMEASRRLPTNIIMCGIFGTEWHKRIAEIRGEGRAWHIEWDWVIFFCFWTGGSPRITWYLFEY